MGRAAANGSGGVAVEDGWQRARLLPTVGIRTDDEREKRATSSLLAVLAAVPEFGKAIVAELGGPRGRLSTYTEVRLKDPAGKAQIPDGAIVAERGGEKWRCLLEVKTGTATLSEEQVNRYLDIARQNRFDAVLTISNQITSSPHESPVEVDGRKLRTVDLHHLSWWRILTQAIVQHRHHGISDPDQAWILGELIAYLDSEKSGASGFQDMGDKWVQVRDAAAAGTLRHGDTAVRDVAERWDQFIEYLCLGLSQDLGAEVRPVRPRKETQQSRIDAIRKEVVDAGKLQGGFRVSDAIGPVRVTADLRNRRVSTSVLMDAPREGRPLTRVRWMLRQLKQAPPDLVIDVSFANSKESSAATLTDALAAPERLLSTMDQKRSPRAFRLVLTRRMGSKRGKGERSFVLETRRQAVEFYRDLVQDLHAWQAPAPKLPEASETGPVTAQPSPPPFSAPTERDPGDGMDVAARRASSTNLLRKERLLGPGPTDEAQLGHSTEGAE